MHKLTTISLETYTSQQDGGSITYIENVQNASFGVNYGAAELLFVISRWWDLNCKNKGSVSQTSDASRFALPLAWGMQPVLLIPPPAIAFFHNPRYDVISPGLYNANTGLQNNPGQSPSPYFMPLGAPGPQAPTQPRQHSELQNRRTQDNELEPRTLSSEHSEADLGPPYRVAHDTQGQLFEAKFYGHRGYAASALDYGGATPGHYSEELGGSYWRRDNASSWRPSINRQSRQDNTSIPSLPDFDPYDEHFNAINAARWSEGTNLQQSTSEERHVRRSVGIEDAMYGRDIVSTTEGENVYSAGSSRPTNHSASRRDRCRERQVLADDADLDIACCQTICRHGLETAEAASENDVLQGSRAVENIIMVPRADEVDISETPLAGGKSRAGVHKGKAPPTLNETSVRDLADGQGTHAHSAKGSLRRRSGQSTINGPEQCAFRSDQAKVEEFQCHSCSRASPLTSPAQRPSTVPGVDKSENLVTSTSYAHSIGRKQSLRCRTWRNLRNMLNFSRG